MKLPRNTMQNLEQFSVRIAHKLTGELELEDMEKLYDDVKSKQQ